VRLREIDWLVWCFAILIALTVALIGWCGYMVWESETSEHYELAKSDWSCTQSSTQTSMVPMLVGKTTIIMPQVSTVCTNYSRR
jgi:TRAP-type C4-dicarboxylate transport system permease small subunit